MQTVGASLFVRNAVKYDYCVEEAIHSVLPLDEIVILDCGSTDGTTEILRGLAVKHKKITLIEGVTWECAENFERLKILANKAIDLLTTDWHFMLQADEVLHELAIPVIREAIEHPFYPAFACRRINLFGNMDHHLRYDLAQERKPVSDIVIRLARKGIMATRDAETLEPPFCDLSKVDLIPLFHYGFVREGQSYIAKVLDMQSWFHGKGSLPDKRVVDMQTDGIFHPDRFFSWDELTPLALSHPIVAKDWVEARRVL